MTMRSSSVWSRIGPAATLLGIAFIVASCTSTPETDPNAIVPGIVEIEPDDAESAGGSEDRDAGDDGATPSAESAEKVFAKMEGTITDAKELEGGDCFNEYRYRDGADVLQQITTVVDCSRPHDKEVYFTAAHPAAEGAPFLRDDINEFARDECLDAFEDFVGEEYVLSQLEIGFLQPAYEGWISEDFERGISCYVFPYEEDRRLQGSMRDIGF